MQVRFEEQDGGVVAFATIPKLGMIDQPSSSVDVDGGITTTVFGRPGFRVALEWFESADATTGRFGFLEGPESLVELAAVDFQPESTPEIRTAPGASRHDATLEIPGGGELPLSLVLADVDGRTFALIDIPAQGLVGFHLKACDAGEVRSSGSMCWTLPVGVDAVLTLEPAGNSWTGRFEQGGLDIPIEFSRASDAAAIARRRPQDPVPPFPYENHEVVVEPTAGHQLAGTLVLPRGTAPASGFPAVVMATGSGGQNRDQEILGHRPFRLLADRLARAGIASLRLDDRGIAGSTGDFTTATTRDFAHDLAAGLAFLRARAEIDSNRSGILGHSEGGTVAALVASGMAPAYPDAAPAFVVSIAGCGVDGGRILADQLPRIHAAIGGDPAEVSRIASLQARVVELARADPIDTQALGDAMVALQRTQILAGGGEVDPDIDESLRIAGLQLMTSPWMREFIRLDPAIAWADIDVPILAINGTLDLQVSVDLNLDAIRAAVETGGGDVRTVRLDGLNHLLQPCTTGLPSEYGVIETTMDESAMRLIAEFIESVGVGPDEPANGD